MGQKEILEILKNFKKRFASKYGILSIGVFGSVVHSQRRQPHDVDIVVRITKPELFLLAGIKNDLEEQIKMPVDIVTYHSSMNPFLKKTIDEEAIYA